MTNKKKLITDEFNVIIIMQLPNCQTAVVEAVTFTHLVY